MHSLKVLVHAKPPMAEFMLVATCLKATLYFDDGLLLSHAMRRFGDGFVTSLKSLSLVLG